MYRAIVCTDVRFFILFCSALAIRHSHHSACFLNPDFWCGVSGCMDLERFVYRDVHVKMLS